jgi:hypothetical protein
MKAIPLLLLATLPFLAACNRDEPGGPGEKAGRNLQDAPKGKK